MPFGVVSGVDRWMGILDGVQIPKEKEWFGVFFRPVGLNGVFWVYFIEQKCVRLMRENLTIFSYSQYVDGIIIHSSFFTRTLLRDRSWRLRETY